MSRNNNYTTGNLLDYAYFSKHYKLIELEDSDLKQQINFIGKLKKEEGATIFFIFEKKLETTFDFSRNSVTVANSLIYKTRNSKDCKFIE